MGSLTCYLIRESAGGEPIGDFDDVIDSEDLERTRSYGPSILQGFSVLRSNGHIYPPFLYWFTRSRRFLNQIVPKMRGSSYPAVSDGDVLACSIASPPLDEQRHIVDWLETIASRVRETDAVRLASQTDVERLRTSVIEEIFETNEGWEARPLGEVIEESRYGTSAKAVTGGRGTPCIRMGNIQRGELVLGDLVYVSLSEVEEERLTLQPGDILVNRTNSPELVGKSAIFDETGKYIFASYLIRLRVQRQLAEPRFVWAFLNSNYGRGYIDARQRRTTGVANINSQMLRSMPVPLPPLDEQRHIVEHLEESLKRIREVQSVQTESQRLMAAVIPSALDQAFRGEV
jgi:type I restriction enzyme, S subunit